MEPNHPIFLVVGLGNPGKSYERTRHNIGFLVIDELCRRAGVSQLRQTKWNCELAELPEFVVMKPLTFMNRSGEAVGPFVRFHKFSAASVLAVVDDTALPLGRLRLRGSGSSGGHNGMASLISHLGTPEFPRLRVGIGSPDFTLHDHVLGRFRDDEEPAVTAIVQRAADAISAIQTHGLNFAMNQFNPLN